jgi:hypothetical protein
MRETKMRFWDGKQMHYPESNYAYQVTWLRTSGWSLWFIWNDIQEPVWEQYGINSEYPMMLFAGLKDNAGKEIYEGDIIEFDIDEWGDTNNKFVVEWDDTNAAWSFGGGIVSDMGFRTVIGNIYEHHNLLNT